MNRIINRKRYNTDLAHKKAFYTNGGTWRDHNHVEETLYQKKTGEFFLHGEGGPATRYAVRVEGNTWDGGEKIIPLTFDEAKDWAEEHLDGDEYEALFGHIEEEPEEEKRPGGNVQINFRVSPSCVATIKRKAAENGQSISEWLEEAARK